METERRISKGGFFQLFDWNSKSRKKLFSNKSESPDTETSKQAKQNVVKSLNYHNLLEVRENGHGLTGKRNGDYISSSVAVDDGYGTKAPGVVARLMGLDSLPTSSASETISIPFCDSSFSLDSCSQRGSSNFRIDYHYVNNIPNERSPRNLVDPRLQNRPIKRFQSETLPPKSARNVSTTHHHRLLSPIKNPGYIPTNDLAYIVEASSKIIDQCPQSKTKGNKLHIVSSSVPLRIHDVRERMEAVPRASGHSEAFRRPKEPAVSQYNRRPSREKNHSGSINAQTNNVLMGSERETSGRLKNIGRSASLAVQAKVNVQQKEGLSSSNSRRSAIRKEDDEVENSQDNQRQMAMQRSVQKINYMSRTSGVHKQNRQKQNCASTRENLPHKSSVPTLQNRKLPSVSGSVRQVKASSKVSNSGAGSRKINTIAKDTGKDIKSSQTKTVSEKKQRSRGNLYFEDTIGDSITMSNNHNKQIKCNITHDDCSSWDDGERKSSMNVVSFTFTSPIKKSHTVSASSGQLKEDGNIYRDDNNCSPEVPTLYSPRSNVTGGDALSVLLEEKIKELTCRVESSQCYFDSAGSASSTSNAMDTSSNGQCFGFELNLGKAKSTAYDVDYASSNDLILKAYGKWKGLQEIEGQSSVNSNSDYGKEREHRYGSLMSTLEPSSSDGSCDSSDLKSISITKGAKRFHLINPPKTVNCISNELSSTLDVDLEFSDSASSSSVAYRNCTSSTISSIEFKRSANWELDYIRKVLFSSDLVLDDLVMGQFDKVLILNLFDHLENSQIFSAEDAEEYFKLERKVLFDCVGECLDLRGEQLLGGNSNALPKWETLFRKKGFLADDLDKEISSWTSMGDLMVDELVDRDMSSGKGKWVDFKTEAFGEGVEIEKALISSLVDEFVADFLVDLEVSDMGSNCINLGRLL